MRMGGDVEARRLRLPRLVVLDVDSFLAGLAQVREWLARNPRAGPPIREDEQHVLRMRLFPRPLPYLAYYGHAKRERIEEVYLVRLYGSGQDRPEFDMSEWRW